MSIGAPKCQYGFKSRDVVITPSNRRAELQKMTREHYWTARYVTARGEVTAEEVVLNPRLIRPE